MADLRPGDRAVIDHWASGFRGWQATVVRRIWWFWQRAWLIELDWTPRRHWLTRSGRIPAPEWQLRRLDEAEQACEERRVR